ncbi:MAG TPA: hypothetical protein VMV38_00540 [Candidatus Paceibacterota bacterium]|nr:hypothetical protein [Candidatus Paceibacterota bacterium]
MDWATRRRIIILLMVSAVVTVLITVVSMVTFYKAPSCSDGIQNQGEAGIDCGGPCAYLCTAQELPPTVLFTKVISNGTGRTDVVASIENTNAAAAAKNVQYTVSVYGPSQEFIQQITGTLDLPPTATVPVFIPGIGFNNQKITNAFLTIDPKNIQWFTASQTIPPNPVVSNITLGGSAATPRIDAILTNASVSALSNVRAIVLVHNAQNEVIAASSTIVPIIPPQGQATASFTWNTAFSDVPTTIEVVPLISLP